VKGLNTNLLKGAIASNGITQKELAKIIGMSNNSLSRKIQGQREFTLGEVVSICKALNISEPADIFFND